MTKVKTGSVRHTPRMLVENGNVEIMKIKTSRWRPKYRQQESTPTHNVRNIFEKTNTFKPTPFYAIHILF